jgi:hypothetical protein
MSESHCVLRVSAADGQTARVSVRRQQFTVGRPIEFDEQAPRISAIEYALGALGGEAVTGLRQFANRHRVPIDDVEALVNGGLDDSMTYLEVVGRSGRPRIGQIHVKVFVTAPDHDAVKRLWSDAEGRLPLLCTLRLAIPVIVDLVFI